MAQAAELTKQHAEMIVDAVDVPSKRVACFTPGKELKALINRDPDESILPALSRVVRVDRYGGLER